MKETILIFLVSFFVLFKVNAQSSYEKTIATIEKHRLEMKKDGVLLDSCNLYLTKTFFNDIFPKWVGTKWDYNGYTNTPGKGTIACGYFVSTTLKHIGFNWNRYKLAQMYSKAIVESVCDSSKYLQTKSNLEHYMEKQSDGIYIVGLSNHVGFIVKINSSSWFVHSNYFGNKGPCKEKITSSAAIDASSGYWIAKFTTNTNAKKWLHKTPYKF